MKDLTNSYLKKNEQLLNEENDLKEKLQNEVTKIKERLEIYFTESNELIKTNDKISKGVKTLESEKDKSILKTLSYISNINKNKKEIKNLLGKLMKNLKISYEKENNRIKYEINYFNGIQIPTKVEISCITLNSCQISWDIDNISLKNAQNKNMEFIIEIRKKDDDDKFKQVYKGNNKKYSLQNLLSNQQYEVRICSVIDDLCGEWSNIISFYTSQSKILGRTKKEKKFLKQIYEWTGLNKIELLYRRSEEEKSSKTFHDRCDNKGPTLCLYENTEGYIFGGYASISWTNQGQEHSAPDSFIFTLTNIYGLNPTKFQNTDKSHSVYHSSDIGPCFFDDIWIYEDMCNERDAYFSFPRGYQDVLGKGKSIFQSQSDIDKKSNYTHIQEIEVFKIFK